MVLSKYFKTLYILLLQAIRAQQEEEVRIKDVQVNELKSFRADLERDFRDSKVIIERVSF